MKIGFYSDPEKMDVFNSEHTSNKNTVISESSNIQKTNDK
jgi:hypothetical protein